MINEHKQDGKPSIPDAPLTIQKGVPLKSILGPQAVEYLIHNLSLVFPDLDRESFQKSALEGIEPLGILERGKKIASVMRQHLPHKYSTAVEVLLASLTPPLTSTEGNGLAVFFYLPHVCFIEAYGLAAEENEGQDPFDVSMHAQYELTRRFSSEFSIRPFLIQEQERTLSRLLEWTVDVDPHVRRLCSEGTRPRLPWAIRIPAFIENPALVIPILERLKDDESLYVRRSVANNLGDIAKDHLELVFEVCERWLEKPSKEVNWLIRHALRYPAKKGNKTALEIRAHAK